MSYPIQPSFTAGELAPSLYARVDLAKYAVGARTMYNAFCHTYGGVSNRGGTEFIGEVSDSDNATRVIDFQFSVTQAYILEFGNQTMRVIKDGGYVLDGGSPYEIVTPYLSADLFEIMVAQTADTLYLTHQNYEPRSLTRLDHDDWDLEVVPFIDGPYLAYESGDEAFEFTPTVQTAGDSGTMTCNAEFFTTGMVGSFFRLGYADAEDSAVIDWGYVTIDSYTSSTEVAITVVADLGFDYIINGDFEDGEANWTNESTGGGTFTVTSNDAYLSEVAGSDVAAMMQASAVPDGSALLLTVVTGGTMANPVRVQIGTTEKGNQVATLDCTSTTTTYTETFTATQDLLYVYAYTNGSSTGDSIISSVSLTFANLTTSEWRAAAFTSDYGYPAAVAFFEQRLIFGGTIAYPQTAWCGNTANYPNFGFNSPRLDSDAFSFTLDARQMNAIKWMFPQQELIIGTAGSEYKVSGGSSSDSMTPTSILARVQSHNGTVSVAPLVVNYTLLYLQRSANAVRDFEYTEANAQYIGNNISVIANHLFKNHTIVDWAYAEIPHSVLWCVRDDGVLLGLTYMKEHDVWGWHWHTTEGGFFESVAVIPGNGSTTGDDEAYFVVRRTIDGNSVRYVERMMPRITDESTYDYYFVDSGLTYTGSAVTTVSGLDHLEGESVVALADGSVVRGLTVVGGSVTLPVPATLIHVGLPYVSDLGTLDVAYADDMGSDQGRTKAVSEVSVFVEDTRSLFAGPDADNLVEVPFRTDGISDDPIGLETGIKNVSIPSGYTTSSKVYFRVEDPVPMTILSVVPNLDVSEF